MAGGARLECANRWRRHAQHQDPKEEDAAVPGLSSETSASSSLRTQVFTEHVQESKDAKGLNTQGLTAEGLAEGGETLAEKKSRAIQARTTCSTSFAESLDAESSTKLQGKSSCSTSSTEGAGGGSRNTHGYAASSISYADGSAGGSSTDAPVNSLVCISSFSSQQARSRRRWRRESNVEEDEDAVVERMLTLSQSDVQPVKYDDNAVAEAVARCFSKSKLCSPMRILQEPQAVKDFQGVLTGGAHHLRGIFCQAKEQDLFIKLKQEIQESGLWNDRGMKHEWSIAKKGSGRTTGRVSGEDAETLARLPAHSFVLEKLAGLFNAEALAWWINLYPGGADTKPFHKDGYTPGKHNITIGGSFGATRNLSFRHCETKEEFHFPQQNGDVFAFREKVNSTFLHGMHAEKVDAGPRISVIIMGRTRD